MALIEAITSFLIARGKEDGINWVQILTTFFSSLPSIIVSVVSVCVLRKNGKEQIVSSDNKIEILKLQQSLSDFYYPYLVLSRKNKALYDVFSKPHKARDPEFRTLIEILNQREFSDNDKAILGEIIDNDIKLNDLISGRSSVVDDEKIRTLLVKSSAHYSIIVLAHGGKITGEVERFAEYVHPNEVYSKIEQKVTDIETRIEALKYGKKSK